MKKHLLLGIFALTFGFAEASQNPFFIYMDPANSGNITNSTAVVQGHGYTGISEMPIKSILYYVPVGTTDTLMTDTFDFTIPYPGFVTMSYQLAALLGNTEYAYNIKGIEVADTTNIRRGDYWYTFTTAPDPVLSTPTVTAVPGATSVAFTVTGDAIGYVATWKVKYGEYGNGFPYETNFEFVTGENQTRVLTAIGLSPTTEYWYRVETAGDMGYWPGPVQTVTTTATEYAQAGVMSHDNVTQDSVTISASGTSGSNVSYDMLIELFGSDTSFLQPYGWVSVSSDTTISHRFGGLMYPGSTYLYRCQVRDGLNIDFSAWGTFTTPQVPTASVQVDSIQEFSDGGIPYVTVNPNGLWSGSSTSVSFRWWSGNLGDTTVVTGITSLAHIPFPAITDVPLGSTVSYQACATNDGGTVCTAISSFNTDDPYAQVLLAIGQTFTMSATSILLQNCEHTCAPGDTARLSVIHGLSPNVYPDTTFIGLINGIATQDITMDQLDPGQTHYFKLIALNSSNVWSWSVPRSEQTDPAQQPSSTISTTMVAENGATIRVFGDAGGYQSTLVVEARRNSNNLVDWTGVAGIGNAYFDETFYATGLAEGEGYTVWACVDNQMGQNCTSEEFQTPTGIRELVMTQNLVVTACDVLGRELFKGPYHEVMAQIPFNTFFTLYMDTEDGRKVVDKVARKF